ncbi:MAG: AI-2E family transporter, partial [Phycisphaeraceae bacterium]
AAFDFWLVVFWPSFVYVVVQFLESWLLTPVIQGRSLDMSIVTILIVVFVGGALGGLYGLILCIPLVACVKILLHEAVLPSIRTWAAEN